MRTFSSSVVLQRLGDVHVPRLAEDAERRAAGVEQRLQARVVLGGRCPCAASMPNAEMTACSSFRSRARSKNSMSLGFEPGKPPSM